MKSLALQGVFWALVFGLAACSNSGNPYARAGAKSGPASDKPAQDARVPDGVDGIPLVGHAWCYTFQEAKDGRSAQVRYNFLDAVNFETQTYESGPNGLRDHTLQSASGTYSITNEELTTVTNGATRKYFIRLEADADGSSQPRLHVSPESKPDDLHFDPCH